MNFVKSSARGVATVLIYGTLCICIDIIRHQGQPGELVKSSASGVWEQC